MRQFCAPIKIIGINPYVSVPEETLIYLFQRSGKEKGPIPVHGTVDGKPYLQNLLRYKGEWRLYINGQMLKNTTKHIGKVLEVSIDWDEVPRVQEIFTPWMVLLEKNPQEKASFLALRPSFQKEFHAYFFRLKSETALLNNLQRALDFLQNKTSFLGRK
jgi:hypothetical protein